MKSSARMLLLLIAWLLLSLGCAPTPARPTLKEMQADLDRRQIEHLKELGDRYRKAYEAHSAPLTRWLEGNQKWIDCLKFAVREPDRYRTCNDALPPPETYIPKDRKTDESLQEYMERKHDEWEEKDCSWKGIMEARYGGESQRIEAQCIQTLEIKRLRKSIEKRNRQ